MLKTRIAIAAAAILAAAGQAQTIEWDLAFTIDTGTGAGTSFNGTLSYDQATLNANFTDGQLFADMGQFSFSVTLPNGVVLDTTNDDPAAVAIFGANELIGLNFIGDNGVEALVAEDVLINVANEFRLFLDPDTIADATGTFTLTRVTPTDISSVEQNQAVASIDDTQIRLQPSVAGSGDQNFEGDLGVSVDADDGPGSVNPSQVLIRFNDLIGNGPNQMPVGSTVVGAVFRVELDSPGSGFTAHRLLKDWDPATVTWNSFVDGIAADDVDAVQQPDFFIEGVGGDILSIELNDTAQAWADGEPNFGFALLPLDGGTDGVDFFTSEAPVGIPARFFPPLLTVSLTDGTVLTFQEGENGFTGTADTTLREQTPDQPFGTLNTTSIDLSDGGFISQYLVRFDDVFGDQPGEIPSTASIASATVKVRSSSPGEDVAIHELLTPFDESRETWNSFGGGVVPDDIEAALTPVTTVSTVWNAANPAFSLENDEPFITIDITPAAQAWAADPATNLGLAFLPLSTNGFDFDAEGTLRPPTGPQMFLSFIPPAFCPADINRDGAADIFDIIAFFDLFGAGSLDADFTGDNALDIFDILAFFDAFALC